jgi:hypothetical protein
MKLSRVPAAAAIALAILATAGCTQPQKRASGLLVVTPQVLSAQDFSEGLAGVELAGKWGYIDKTGVFKIKPQYKGVAPFFNGVATVTHLGTSKIGLTQVDLIKSSGKVIKTFFLGSASFILNEPGTLTLQNESDPDPNKWTCQYLGTDGELLFKKTYLYCGGFKDGLAAAQDSTTRLSGFINHKGQWVIPAKYEGCKDFSEGLAPVQIALGTGKSLWGFINAKGEWVINPQYANAHSFSDGYARVEDPGEGNAVGKHGFIDKKGTLVVPKIWYSLGTRYFQDEDFHSGFVVESTQGGLGFMDPHQYFLGTLRFDNAGEFQSGYAPVEVKGKWGFLGLDGKYAVTPQFDEVFWYSESLAPVRIGDLWGYIG